MIEMIFFFNFKANSQVPKDAEFLNLFKGLLRRVKLDGCGRARERSAHSVEFDWKRVDFQGFLKDFSRLFQESLKAE